MIVKATFAGTPCLINKNNQTIALLPEDCEVKFTLGNTHAIVFDHKIRSPHEPKWRPLPEDTSAIREVVDLTGGELLRDLTRLDAHQDLMFRHPLP